MTLPNKEDNNRYEQQDVSKVESTYEHFTVLDLKHLADRYLMVEKNNER